MIRINSVANPDADPDPDHKMFMFTKEMAYKNISLQNIKKTSKRDPDPGLDPDPDSNF